MNNWLDKELSSCVFKDKRLGDRFKLLVQSLHGNHGKSIPQIFQEWGATKAVYRFLSNDRIEEHEILEGHFNQTQERIENCSGPILILHDTTEFSYNRKKPEEIGYTRKNNKLRSYDQLIPTKYKVCGILMHASLAITPEGIPLGLTSTRFWSRHVFKNTTQMKRYINPTRVPINEKESIKWIKNLEESNEKTRTDPSQIIHVGDRESDIYEYFSSCSDLGSYFLVRACVNRLANETTIVEELGREKKLYNHKISFQNAKGKKINAKLKIKVKTLKLHPPVDKKSNYSDLQVTVISAVETDNPIDREKIKWTLLTNLPVTNKKQAILALEWYKQRWRIEEYFKILKSGLRIEESKLRTADRLTKLISISCILAWRIQWLTMLNRSSNTLNPRLVFSSEEIKVMRLYFNSRPKYLHECTILLARLGGYLNRKNDPPPGNKIIWRGFNKLFELQQGFTLAQKCG